MNSGSSAPISSGSHLFETDNKINPKNDLGYITSSCYSPTLKSYIALGFLKDGCNRHGDKIKICNPLLGKQDLAEVCNPIFVDPKGEKLRA